MIVVIVIRKNSSLGDLYKLSYSWVWKMTSLKKIGIETKKLVYSNLQSNIYSGKFWWKQRHSVFPVLQSKQHGGLLNMATIYFPISNIFVHPIPP